jgi:soluble lytic murein transglycosylase-like protein
VFSATFCGSGFEVDLGVLLFLGGLGGVAAAVYFAYRKNAAFRGTVQNFFELPGVRKVFDLPAARPSVPAGPSVSLPPATGGIPLAVAGPRPAGKHSGEGLRWDAMIRDIAGREGISPILLKAIVRKESFFDPMAINPETSFTFDGTRYASSSRTGRAKLTQYIMEGHDPGKLGLNPSIGLAQVRIRIAKSFVAGITARDLFDPGMNLTASARLLRQLQGAGITLQTIDAYNVGQDLDPRNFPYRDEVVANYRKFEGDF